MRSDTRPRPFRRERLLTLMTLLMLGCSEQSDRLETPAPAPEPVAAAAEYVGSDACRDCHAAEHAALTDSHHDLALQSATPDTVLAHGGTKLEGTAFESKDGRLTISPDAGNSLTPRFTFGVTPLQQYVVDGDNGAWQTYPIAWDSRPASAGGQRWFNLNDGIYPPGDPMHSVPLFPVPASTCPGSPPLGTITSGHS